jgi:TolB protein
LDFQTLCSHAIIVRMLVRLFRLSDRLGKLLVKVSVWLSGHLLSTFQDLSVWVRSRRSSSALDSDTARTETQVQSLSGVTVVLLAAVVILIFWTTNSQTQAASGVPIFSIDQSGSSGEQQSAAPTPVTTVVEVPEIHSTGTLVFSMWVGAQQDLFALAAGQSIPTRLTDNAADDREPVWSPDGSRLAFASRRDGNWELYILEMASGDVTRLTSDLVFESNPSWSPDGLWLAYEGYADGNLDVYIVKADASEGPYAVTRQPGPDFSPAWTTASSGPTDRLIAYTSMRGANQDIYLITLANPIEDLATNLTNTPDVQENNAAWSPDGTMIAYDAEENGVSLVYTRSATAPSTSPTPIGEGHSPAWAPDGSQLAYLADRPSEVAPVDTVLVTAQIGTFRGAVERFLLPARAASVHWTAASMPPPQGTLAFAATAPLPAPFAEPVTAPTDQNPFYLLRPLPGVVPTSAVLSDRVDSSFMALRDLTNQAAGWDFLGRLDSVWWPLNRPLEPGQDLQSWHKAGRAFDIVQAYNQGSPAQVEIVQEQIGPDIYWRMYVRAALQDGTLGEPLHSMPWDFAARTSGDIAAYEAGGRLKDTVPSGYYIDFTRLALSYGWARTPAATTWRGNWPGVLYWQYEKRDGLDWWAAMLELYPQSSLEEQIFTPVPGPTQQPTIVTPTVQSTPSRPSPTPTVPPG